MDKIDEWMEHSKNSLDWGYDINREMRKLDFPFVLSFALHICICILIFPSMAVYLTLFGIKNGITYLYLKPISFIKSKLKWC